MWFWCFLENGKSILMVVIYISSNRRAAEIIKFINQIYLANTADGTALVDFELGIDYFNVKLASEESQSLIKEKLIIPFDCVIKNSNHNP